MKACLETQPQPLVSFIIAYYNLPTAMLTACIESIVALSLRAFEREIIVVDDGSDQSPVEALKPFADTIVYLRTPNGGLSQARNNGLRLARGRYIQFVDADDYLLQSAYEHCLDHVRYGKSDVIMFDFCRSEERTQKTFTDTQPVSGTHFMRHNNIHAMACGYLFRQSLLGELRFTQGIVHEDELFTPQLLLRAEQVVATNAKAYFYRRRPGSIVSAATTRQTLRRLNDFHYVIGCLHRQADTLPADGRTALERRVAQLTMDYIYNIIVLTRSRHYLDRQLEKLRQEGLFPLPDNGYTPKYTWFRRLSNSSAGISLLLRVLPQMGRER